MPEILHDEGRVKTEVFPQGAAGWAWRFYKADALEHGNVSNGNAIDMQSIVTSQAFIKRGVLHDGCR